jgi:hypothetical protein
MTELDHAESTVKLYLSCINDVAKAMALRGTPHAILTKSEPSNSSLRWDG